MVDDAVKGLIQVAKSLTGEQQKELVAGLTGAEAAPTAPADTTIGGTAAIVTPDGKGVVAGGVQVTADDKTGVVDGAAVLTGANQETGATVSAAGTGTLTPTEDGDAKLKVAAAGAINNPEEGVLAAGAVAAQGDAKALAGMTAADLEQPASDKAALGPAIKNILAGKEKADTGVKTGLAMR